MPARGTHALQRPPARLLILPKAAERAGTEYLLVEQDDCNGEDPFGCMARSYRYLAAQGLR